MPLSELLDHGWTIQTAEAYEPEGNLIILVNGSLSMSMTVDNFELYETEPEKVIIRTASFGGQGDFELAGGISLDGGPEEFEAAADLSLFTKEDEGEGKIYYSYEDDAKELRVAYRSGKLMTLFMITK